MADNNENKAADTAKTPSAGEQAIADGRLEVNVGGGNTSVLDAGGKASTKPSAGVMLDVAAGEGAERAGIGDAPELDDETLKDLEKDGEEGEGEKAGEDPDKGDEDTKEGADEAAAYEPLPEFDPENEEVAAAYDSRFLKDDGEDGQALNTEAIADEIRANMAKPEGERSERPNEGTYKWLRSKLGITRDMVDAHIEGEKAKYLQQKAALDEVTGGEEAWKAKLAWASTKEDGTQGGYTKEQVARFNAAMKEGGAAAAEQIELLNERYARANPDAKANQGAAPAKPAAKQGVGLNQRRPASPAKSTQGAANGGSNAGPKPFKDASEHQKELAALSHLKQGPEREAKHKELRARLAASPWWRNGQH
ncbi:hypothetical protein [Mesorhizobium sp. WSM4982]|uniref:hypothetical protein n=1 Tax=Mesorhizobium sp. WSM4982 TaxID=3038550 RepID=UPI00241565CF|nr:hypothetical protein [Mesorhizobium sp. WSM4982]MDG4856424.1 hypothetical protein [Mesorhizobium sp. WSM4982]